MKSSPHGSGIAMPIFSSSVRASKRKGFSLIELVVCIGILTTGLIFIVDIFSTMLNATTKGADWSVATYLLAEQLDTLTPNPTAINTILLMPSGPIAIPFFGGAGDPAGAQAVNDVTYSFNFTISKVFNGVTPRGTSTQLYLVDVSTSWRGAKSSSAYSSQGYGRLYEEMSRLVYVH